MIIPSDADIYRQRPPSRMSRYSYGVPTPEELAGVIERLRSGHVDRYAALTSQMQLDAHVRSTYGTLLAPIGSAKLVFDGGDTPEGKRDAEVLSRVWDEVRRPADLLMGLAHAHGVGWSIHEMRWARVRGLWMTPELVLVDTADTRLTASYGWEVQTWPEDASGRVVDEWLSTEATPARWLVHNPTQVGLPAQMGGLLLTCAWDWLFGRWATVWGAEAMEREGIGMWLGSLPQDAGPDAADALRAELEQMTAGKVGVARDGTTIQLLESGRPAGEAHRAAQDRYESRITKALLGSTLNVEVGSTGGNRALGESQAAMTIVPRHLLMASSIVETLREQWASAVMALNPVAFDGRRQPPVMELQVVTEAPPVITPDAVATGVVTKNELRRSCGLEERDGLDVYVTPLAKTSPGAAGMLSGWTRSRTLRTSTRSPLTTLSAPADLWDSPELWSRER